MILSKFSRSLFVSQTRCQQRTFPQFKCLSFERYFCSSSAQYPPKKVSIYKTTCTNPYWNLAFEEWLLRNFDCSNPANKTLFLWQNNSTVVMGRHQNPWKECNLNLLWSLNGHLTRRESGGGCVYHDLGNTNVTFFSTEHKPFVNLELIVNVLRNDFGIHTEISPKRDLLLSGRKVSGSAYRITGKRVYHHCTLLLHSDLTTLVNVLNPSHSSSLCKFETKATQSTRMPVANLCEVNPSLSHESLCHALIRAFLQSYNDGQPLSVLSSIRMFSLKHISLTKENVQIIDVSQEDLERNTELHEKYNLFISWEWIYGHTPHFTQTFHYSFSWATITLQLQCDNAIIEKVELNFDVIPHNSELQSLQQQEEFKTILTKCLCGVRFTHEAIQRSLLHELNLLSSHSRQYYVEFFQWLLQQIPRTP